MSCTFDDYTKNFRPIYRVVITTGYIIVAENDLSSDPIDWYHKLTKTFN